MLRLSRERGGSRGNRRLNSAPGTCALTVLCLLLAAPVGSAQEAPAEGRVDPNLQLDATSWSVMVFKGWSNYHTLGRTVRFIWDYAGEDVYGFEAAYTIPVTTGFGGWFDRVLAARFFAAAKLNARAQPSRDWIPELSIFVGLRWRNLPWNHIVATSFAVGDGLSIVGEVPEVEVVTTEVGGTNHLLNYLMFEATFALPSYPYLQLVGRIHHRSGVFGVFNEAQESGSNTVGLGIRWHF